MRHVGAAPTRSVWKTDMLAVTSMPRNWSLEWVVRPPLRIFNPPLIYLSHPALDKMVPLRGDAPRSAGYRPAALLLSYRGMKNEIGGVPHSRSVKWYPHQDLHLEPRPLEAAYALLLHLAGIENGSPGWIRTIASALTERHPTSGSPRILKWWTRTVTLRLLLYAKPPCCLLSLRAL